MFAERYLNELSTSNQQDDDQHHQRERSSLLCGEICMDVHRGRG